MSKTQNKTNEFKAVRDKKVRRATIESLIADLESKDGVVRVNARRQLVGYKARAVSALVETLSNKNDWVRWEAAKTLSQIGNPASIKALLGALSDKRFEVRWLAAEGLIRIGRKALVPLLEALVEDSGSYWLREGIHHVLHDIKKGNLAKVVRPVLAALEGTEPSLEVPLVSRAALDVLKEKATY